MSLVTRVVQLGAVELGDGLGGTPIPGSVVVGDPPQWSDGSMESYATTHSKQGAGDSASAQFDSVCSSTAVVRSIEVSAVIAGGGQAGTAWVAIGHYPRDGWEESARFTIPGDTIPRTYTTSLGLELGAPPLVAGGAAFFYFDVPVSDAAVYAATCYEFTLTVTLWDQPPPRRIFPRDDGLTGGAPRVFPPSKGYQSGNRAAGGYV